MRMKMAGAVKQKKVKAREEKMIIQRECERKGVMKDDDDDDDDAVHCHCSVVHHCLQRLPMRSKKLRGKIHPIAHCHARDCSDNTLP